MTWRFQPAMEKFQANRELWDSLNASRGGHVLLDSTFVSCLLKYFGNEGVLLGIREEPAAAMALLEKKSAGNWETFQPSQAPLGLIVCGQTDDTGEVLTSLLRSLPGYALQLGVLHQDPDFSPFLSPRNDGAMEKLDYIRTARIPLSGSFEEYWKGREGGLRKNNNRLRRRMMEKGLKPEFVVIREPSEVANAISEYGRLESKGWKAIEGTAVKPDTQQGHYYRELLESLCARGEGAVYQLRVNGQVIASDICVVRQGMLVLLKTAYDEDWSVYSPAFLLREDILSLLYAEGVVRTYEFYGPLMDYQLRWTDQVRTLFHLNCYRYGWLPSLKSFAHHLRVSMRPPVSRS
jgi:CelD/BcsL family acetyltransferase involved in cellulose biosynthesis